jgi:hypothetical protein
MARTVMRWQDVTSGLIELDAVTLFAPDHGVEITDYPIELGANLTDHIREQPVRLRVNGVVTNSPSRLGLSQLDGSVPATDRGIRVRQPLIPAPPALVPTSLAGIPIERETTVIAQVRTWSQAGAAVQRVQNVYALLLESMRAAREFTVSTDLLGDFDRMLIEKVSPERTSTTGNGVTLSLSLKQVSYAELVRRDVSHLLKKAKPKTKTAEALKDEGKKEAVDADAHSNTWLFDIWGAIAP